MSRLNQFKIGAYIKNLRQKRNMSQAELGQKLGMSQNNISKIENDLVPLTHENICILSIILDVNPMFFFDFEPFVSK